MTSAFEPEAQRLLQLARDADEPSAAQLLSLHGAVAAGIAAEGASSVAGATAGAKAASGSALVKGLVAAGAIATGAAGFFALAAPPAEPVASPPVLVAQARPVATALPAPSALTSAAPVPTPSAAPARAAKPSVGLRLQDEAALLADVQGALRAGRAGAALTLLDGYDLRFPGGVLRSEADAARVFAWCAAGRVDRARAFAERFVERYPNAPATARVRSACK